MGQSPQPALEPHSCSCAAGWGASGWSSRSRASLSVSAVLFSSPGSGGWPWSLSLGGPHCGVLTSQLWRPQVSENVLSPACSGGLWIRGARGLWASGPSGVCSGPRRWLWHTQPFVRVPLHMAFCLHPSEGLAASQHLLPRCNSQGENGLVCILSPQTVAQTEALTECFHSRIQWSGLCENA